MSGQFYVYAHKRPSDGHVFYIGKGKGPRAHSHDRSKYWKRYVAKYGVEVEIVKDNLKEDVAYQLERRLIEKHKKLGACDVNIAAGGLGGVSYKSKAVKQKIWEWSLKHGKRPSQRSKDKEEKRLGVPLSSYTSPNSKCYDKEFADEYIAKFPVRKTPTAAGYIEFCRTENEGYHASHMSKNAIEKKWGQWINNQKQGVKGKNRCNTELCIANLKEIEKAGLIGCLVRMGKNSRGGKNNKALKVLCLIDNKVYNSLKYMCLKHNLSYANSWRHKGKKYEVL